MLRWAPCYTDVPIIISGTSLTHPIRSIFMLTALYATKEMMIDRLAVQAERIIKNFQPCHEENATQTDESLPL